VWHVPLAQVLPHPQLIFFSLPKPGFLGIYLNFQGQKSLKNQYLQQHSESKSYQINSIKNPAHQDLSNNTKGKLHQILIIKTFPTTPKANSNSSEILSCDLILFSV
jgi:hypothetical protein